MTARGQAAAGMRLGTLQDAVYISHGAGRAAAPVSDQLERAAEVPKEAGKSLCACFGCKLVKTQRQFLEGGCENCPFLNMEGDVDRVHDATTVNFSGLSTQLDPEGSWVAKWQHTDRFAPGCYALTTKGVAPDDVDDLIRQNRGRR